MRITDLLDERSICLNGSPTSKEDALNQMVALMVKSGNIKDEEAYKKQVYLRGNKKSGDSIGKGRKKT